MKVRRRHVWPEKELEVSLSETSPSRNKKNSDHTTSIPFNHRGTTTYLLELEKKIKKGEANNTLLKELQKFRSEDTVAVNNMISPPTPKITISSIPLRDPRERFNQLTIIVLSKGAQAGTVG